MRVQRSAIVRRPDFLFPDTYAAAESKIDLAQEQSQLSSESGQDDIEPPPTAHLSRTRGKQYVICALLSTSV